ncbi:CocE/NonD family hydrolase [Rhizohabitans arisaemae]|uniref:CocE/NonD family hydrolase n=1 Tax=Rhizohabitans arisaemae TaxID=2720610 RepID=UPI0024B107C8|nr:CocE/NonD family hydrolase [Rhizohabitans arisaemae]
MNVVVERDVPVPMRDGVTLRADVFRPAEPGRYPVLLTRTPYDKDQLHLLAPILNPIKAAGSGYVVVQQDVRGRFASEGEFHPIRHEQDDGVDTIAWAASLPYGNGDVGQFGLSYAAMACWMSASAAPPALRAIFASESPGEKLFWRGGALEQGALERWALWAIGPHALERAGGAAGLAELIARNDTGAAQPYPDYLGFLPDFAAGPGPELDTPPRYDTIGVPALIVAGWADFQLGPDLAHWAGTKGDPRTRLVVGPWSHGMFRPVVGAADFGQRATGVLDLTAETHTTSLMGDFTWFTLRWFDHWLRGADNGVAQEPRVRIFVQGANRWRDEDDWPLARARDRRWFLHTEGELAERSPAADAAESVFTYDPADPCPTRGGTLLLADGYAKGAVDQTPLLDRADVLVYTSPPLAEDLEVTGPVRAVLFAAAGTGPADWVVKLCDVHPDGRTLNVCDGIRRVGPGEETCEVDMLATATVFRAGHRLRVLVTASDHPRYDLCGEAGGRWVFPGSHLVLPVVTS